MIKINLRKRYESKTVKKESTLAKWIWFAGGTFSGAMALSLSMASVRPGSVFRDKISDDTAIYQELSEIRVQKQAKINFDSDINHLSKIEKRYREKLPKLTNAQAARLVAPMMRVERMKYTASRKNSRR